MMGKGGSCLAEALGADQRGVVIIGLIAAALLAMPLVRNLYLEEFHLDPQTDVIRHYDVSGKRCPLYYVENPEAWTAFLADVTAQLEE